MLRGILALPLCSKDGICQSAAVTFSSLCEEARNSKGLSLRQEKIFLGWWGRWWADDGPSAHLLVELCKREARKDTAEGICFHLFRNPWAMGKSERLLRSLPPTHTHYKRRLREVYHEGWSWERAMKAAEDASSTSTRKYLDVKFSGCLRIYQCVLWERRPLSLKPTEDSR